MTVTVCTQNYVATHGKAPRGTGQWAFRTDTDRTFWSPTMRFRDARRWVRVQARDEGFDTVYVGA